jgi:hypothetical protein
VIAPVAAVVIISIVLGSTVTAGGVDDSFSKKVSARPDRLAWKGLTVGKSSELVVPET